MKKLIIVLIILTAACSGFAQDASYTLFRFDGFIPNININDQNYDLQKSVMPNIYKERPIRQDMRWLKANDSDMVQFWNETGDSVLHILSELSGISWDERTIDIHFLRYFPSLGSSDPLIIPLGGINNNSFTIASPEIYRQKFNLIYQLSLRMLKQADLQTNNSNMYYVSHHPLMQPSEYRRDVLAMLLAVNVSYTILGVDSTENSERSLYWKNNFPGHVTYVKHLRDRWFISPDKTLSDYLIDEPYNSKLVRATRAPKTQKRNEVQVNKMFIEDLPLKGQLGFSVKFNDAAQLVVYKIDEYRLGYLSGLREGDIIRRINSRLVRNQKTMVEYILAGFKKSGAIVEVSRGSNVIELLFQPLETEFFPDTENVPDEDDYNLPVQDSL